jgi:Putative MetA-pathway of phenol degradation
VAAAVGVSVAAAAESDRIQPDRPNFSASTYTVAPGVLQIESGAQYSHTSIGGSPADREFSLDVMLRVGLTERIELRLQGEPLVVLRGERDDTGNGDISLQAKYRFFDAREGRWWPSLAVLPFVRFPIAHEPHGTNLPDFALIGLASFSLPWGLGLDVNAGVGGNGQRPGGYLVQGVAAASVSRDIAERWATYAEVFFTSAAERGGRAQVGFDAGVQFFVTQRLALDAAAETSLTGPGPDYAFRAGLSVRFGR